MRQQEFERIIDTQLKYSRNLLLEKNAGYAANEDKLNAFRKAAQLQGKSMREALAGMMAKHAVSIFDMCEGDNTHDPHVWDEKITDNINYLLLLSAVLYDERSGLAPTYDELEYDYPHKTN